MENKVSENRILGLLKEKIENATQEELEQLKKELNLPPIADKIKCVMPTEKFLELGKTVEDKTFEEQFPELEDKIVFSHAPDFIPFFSMKDIRKHCLSRKRVLEAIEKVEKGILKTSYIDCDSHERKTVSVAYLNILKNELGLDKEE